MMPRYLFQVVWTGPDGEEHTRVADRIPFIGMDRLCGLVNLLLPLSSQPGDTAWVLASGVHITLVRVSEGTLPGPCHST